MIVLILAVLVLFVPWIPLDMIPFSMLVTGALTGFPDYLSPFDLLGVIPCSILLILLVTLLTLAIKSTAKAPIVESLTEEQDRRD